MPGHTLLRNRREHFSSTTDSIKCKNKKVLYLKTTKLIAGQERMKNDKTGVQLVQMHVSTFADLPRELELWPPRSDPCFFSYFVLV